MGDVERDRIDQHVPLTEVRALFEIRAARAFAALGAQGAPGWPEADGRVKTSAAWLIGRAGFECGHAHGRAAISSKHTLALTNRGGATTEELLALAREVRDGVRERFGVGFRHNEQSLRIAEELNLTHEVRDGILTHTGVQEPATLEGRIVRLVDRVAYINHDIDDAIRFGILGASDLPRAEIELLGATGARRIDTLVHDLVEHSERAGDIVQGTEVGRAMLRLRSFMFERVYLGPRARAEHAKIERVLRGLFDWYCEHPEALPEGEGPDRVIDYLAGMTDRFAIRAWSERFVPQGLAL